jgi:hypothetical protein
MVSPRSDVIEGGRAIGHGLGRQVAAAWPMLLPGRLNARRSNRGRGGVPRGRQRLGVPIVSHASRYGFSISGAEDGT